jgi:hypothetical protein
VEVQRRETKSAVRSPPAAYLKAIALGLAVKLQR